MALAVERAGVSEEEKRRLRELINELGMDSVRRWELDRRLSGQDRCRPERIAWLYAVIGECDRAFEWLEKSWEQPLWGSENAPSCFWWDPLHGDPRFEQLLRDQNLTEEVIQRHLRVQ